MSHPRCADNWTISTCTADIENLSEGTAGGGALAKRPRAPALPFKWRTRRCRVAATPLPEAEPAGHPYRENLHVSPYPHPVAGCSAAHPPVTPRARRPRASDPWQLLLCPGGLPCREARSARLMDMQRARGPLGNGAPTVRSRAEPRHRSNPHRRRRACRPDRSQHRRCARSDPIAHATSTYLRHVTDGIYRQPGSAIRELISNAVRRGCETRGHPDRPASVPDHHGRGRRHRHDPRRPGTLAPPHRWQTRNVRSKARPRGHQQRRSAHEPLGTPPDRQDRHRAVLGCPAHPPLPDHHENRRRPTQDRRRRRSPPVLRPGPAT